jgi:diguanylate cyclase (GGDEF)-like protein
VMFDLDRFKAVNDLHGHDAGDHVLRTISNRVRRVLPVGSLLARLGGDEFAIILDETDRRAAYDLAQTIIAAARQPIAIAHLQIDIGVSIGLAFCPEHGRDASVLLKSADRALYAAKRQGFEPIRAYHPDMDADKIERAALTARLPSALINGEIELHFQPIVDAQTGRCGTAEALLRWTHPILGRIAPDLVVALAEESRLIDRLGSWIVRQALLAARHWPSDIVVAVNISASQFNDVRFADRVMAALREAGLPPSRLELELTETVLCEDAAATTIRQLRDRGVRLSLDDFGTGYASLSYLLRFPFDRVKIDRGFVSEIDSREDRRIIVEAVASLAAKLGLEIVAEGIESDAERETAARSGCTFLQGYLFGRPMPERDFRAFLARQQAEA